PRGSPSCSTGSAPRRESVRHLSLRTERTYVQWIHDLAFAAGITSTAGESKGFSECCAEGRSRQTCDQSLRTTMIYTHVLNREGGECRVRSTHFDVLSH